MKKLVLHTVLGLSWFEQDDKPHMRVRVLELEEKHNDLLTLLKDAILTKENLCLTVAEFTVIARIRSVTYDVFKGDITIVARIEESMDNANT